MRKLLLIYLCIVLFSIYFIPQVVVKSASTPPLTIKEIMPDPTGEDNLYEWIEVQNNSTAIVQLNAYKINGTKLPTVSVLPQEIFILARNTSYIYSRYPDLTNMAYNFSFSLANAGGTVNLTDNNDQILQTFNYGQSQEGKTYELLEGTCRQILLNTTAVGHTIGKLNTQCSSTSPTTGISSTPQITGVTSTPLISKYSNLLEIAQVKPCSSIESIIINSNDSYDIDLTKWQLDIDDENSMYLANMAINSKSTIIITLPDQFLPDSGGRIRLIDPSGNQKDVFKYSKCQDANDYFEITSGYAPVEPCLNSSGDTAESVSSLGYPKIYDKSE